MVVLDVKDRLRYHLEFERRLSFIRGDSGSGKTELCRLLIESERDTDIIVDVTGLDKVSLVQSQDTIDAIPTKFNTLFIFDDFSYTKSYLLVALYKNYAVKNNLYFVFMSRVDYDGTFLTGDTSEGQDVGGSLSYSVNSVYDLSFSNDLYTLVPHYVFPGWKDTNFDVVLTEDTGKVHDYLKSIIRIKTEPTEVGKATINKDILRLLGEGNKSILVLMDTASFGCHMEQFTTLFSDSCYNGCNVAFMSIYECFEELLCQSNMIRPLTKELDNIEINANNYTSWEKYFENLLERLTKGRPCSFKHRLGIVRDCFSISCNSCNPHKRSKCSCVLPGQDKLKALFIGTKYEFLLKIMR